MFTLLVGIISMVTPIPGGVVVIALSLTSLTCTSPRAQSFIKYSRENSSLINRLFFSLEKQVGSRISIIGDALKLTQPDSSSI